VLSGRAAAWLWGLIRGPAPPPEVTSPRERKVPGVLTCRSRRLDPRDTTIRDGIPIVTVARALVDLAAELSPDALARACHEAGVRYRTTPAQVEATLSRRPNAPGAAGLRRVLRGDEQVALSRLESRFLELVRAQRLPLPATNKPAGGRRVDCRWVEQRVTIELDSYAFHNSRHAWERDHSREREAYARGDQFRRYTWGDVFEQPEPMLRELRGLL
jgi:very-short-patch-repair endonuclease